MIDKVFGVDDNQDYNRFIINEKYKDLIKDWVFSFVVVVMEERKLLIIFGFYYLEEGIFLFGSKCWVL